MKILFFHASYCGSCPETQFAAIQYAEKIGAKFQTFHVQDIYKGAQVAKQYGVKHVPCLILLDEHGIECARLTGGQTSQEIEKVFAVKGGVKSE